MDALRLLRSWCAHYPPLHAAGCMAWLASAVGIWRELAPGGSVVGTGSPHGFATALLVLFLAGFFAILLPTASEAASRRKFAISAVVMSACTFALLLLRPSNFSPILLVVTLVVIASSFPPRAAGVAFGLMVVAFYAIVRWQWQLPGALLIVSAYASFGAFAALSSHARAKADAAAMALRTVNAELLATRALLAESVRDGERLRVSRELHDVAGHKLTALSLNLELLRDEVAAPAPRELDVAARLSAELLSDIRAVVSRLRRDDGIDLREALAALAALYPHPPIAVEVGEGVRVLGAEAAEVLLRAAQEGITNSVRHARARQVRLSLLPGPERLALVVEDDGQFTGELRPGNGLTGLRERVQELGGEVTIERAFASGLRLTVALPIAGQV